MKSKDYWKKRSEKVARKQYKKVDKDINSMELEYEIAKDSIQKDIESFYARFASNNQVTLDEARKLLNSNELREFKMGLKEFRKKAKNNPDGIWTQELNNVYYKTRVSRLEALKAQIQVKVNSLSTSQLEGTTELLNGIYEDTYYRNIFEMHNGLGIGVNFAKLDTNTINKAITEPWCGDNYSSRIWDNKDKLIMELQTNLTQAFIRGDSIDKTSKLIAERMNVAKNRARTLVNTESSYITSKATFDSYSRSGVVKQYEILATLDLRTSKICRSMDGKVVNLSEKEIGVNAPPFHPNCRTTIVPYFDAIDEERIARDSEGKNYPVKGDISYQQWYDKYVKGNAKEEIAEKKIQNKASDKKQFERYREVLGKDLTVKDLKEFQELKYNNVSEWNVLKSNYVDTNRYNKIISETSNLNIKGVSIKNIDRINLKEYKFDFNHINNERQHGVTKEMAQEFINNSKAAYSRWNGQVIIYVSEEGCTLVNLKDKNVRTAYASSEYDSKFKKLMEVLKND